MFELGLPTKAGNTVPMPGDLSLILNNTQFVCWEVRRDLSGGTHLRCIPKLKRLPINSFSKVIG